MALKATYFLKWLPKKYKKYHSSNTNGKNLGRLWLAYTELQVEFYMLQVISVDSRHFTQS